MAVASGYQYNPNTNRWELSEKNLKDPGVKKLRDNLSVLSTFSPTHPATALIEKAIIPGVAFIGSKAAPVIKKVNVKAIPSIEYIKNTYNRYTAPKTDIVMTPYKGDQFLLAKYRLRNGGFDKLGITPDDIIYVPKGHPMYIEPNGEFMSHLESPVKARKFLLKSEAIPLIDEYKGIASYSGGTKLFTQPTVGKWGTLDKETKSITSHEFLHAIDDVIKSKNVSSVQKALIKFLPKKGLDWINPRVASQTGIIGLGSYSVSNE